MTSAAERQRELDDASGVDAFGRCSTCSMGIRRDEMDVHLAHSHNIGPVVKKEKNRDGAKRRRSSRDE
jgi:hypothetical protein